MSGQRPKNLGQQGGILESQQGDRGQHAPGRNPQQEDRSAREMTGGQNDGRTRAQRQSVRERHTAQSSGQGIQKRNPERRYETVRVGLS